MNMGLRGSSFHYDTNESAYHNRSDSNSIQIFKCLPKRYNVVQIIGLLIFLFCVTSGAYGDFVVQPMKIELTLRPGVFEPSEIILQNQSKNEVYTVRLSAIELSQYENGTWRPIDPNEPLSADDPYNLSKAASCLSWIRIRDNQDKQEIKINPVGMKQVKLDIRVPAGVRGFYCAAIKAGLLPRPGQTGVAVQYEFIIPVLITIEGPALRHRVQFLDCGLESQIEKDSDDEVSTLVSLDIENLGQTYSTLHGLVQIQAYLQDGNWRTIVREIKFDKSSIIPGSHLRLRKKLDRPLPSGQYKVKAALYVDEKLERAIENQINLVSEHSGPLKADAVVKTNPELIQLNARPGMSDRQILEVYNDSDDSVTIRAYTAVPKELGGYVLGNTRGDDQGCSKWIEIRPDEVTLKPYGKKNITIRTRMPEDIQPFSSFYADLNLYAGYSDGSNAGSTSVPICVKNQDMSPRYVVTIKKLDINEIDRDQSIFMVVASVINMGDMYIQPDAIVRLVQPDGNIIRSGELKTNQSGYILPFETRTFSGIMNLSMLDEGVYRLETQMTYAENETVREDKTIQVFTEGSRREVKVISEKSYNAQLSKQPTKVDW